MPGDSSAEAKILPIMTVEAPVASAFTISPENLIPPSAITGIFSFFATFKTSASAVICGTPIPEIILVVQIAPGPIPTRSPSAPAFINALAPSSVAIFPGITSIFGKFFLMYAVASIIGLACPCAESTIIASTPALTNALILS